MFSKEANVRISISICCQIFEFEKCSRATTIFQCSPNMREHICFVFSGSEICLKSKRSDSGVFPHKRNEKKIYSQSSSNSAPEQVSLPRENEQSSEPIIAGCSTIREKNRKSNFFQLIH